jgi:hypothetical protein
MAPGFSIGNKAEKQSKNLPLLEVPGGCGRGELEKRQPFPKGLEEMPENG